MLTAQRNEITEQCLYAKLARVVEDEHNKAVLTQVSQEGKHYRFWREYAGEEVSPDRVKIWWFYLLARLFGARAVPLCRKE